MKSNVKTLISCGLFSRLDKQQFVFNLWPNLSLSTFRLLDFCAVFQKSCSEHDPEHNQQKPDPLDGINFFSEKYSSPNQRKEGRQVKKKSSLACSNSLNGIVIQKMAHCRRNGTRRKNTSQAMRVPVFKEANPSGSTVTLRTNNIKDPINMDNPVKDCEPTEFAILLIKIKLAA